MRIGISLTDLVPEQEPDGYIAVAQAAERLGFASAFVPQHLARTWGQSFLDPLVTLGLLAGATSRLMLGTTVIVLPYYQPLIAAHQLATLDRLSGGRIICGVGVGWQESEFAALGVPYAERGVRTDEALELMQLLWRGDSVSFAGRFNAFAPLELGVSPHTPGGPAVWVGGDSAAAIKRTVRYGQGWHGFDATPEQVRSVAAQIATVAARSGRNPAEIVLTTTHPVRLPEPHERFTLAAQYRSELVALAEAGVSEAVLRVPGPTAAMIATLEWLTEAVVPLTSDK